MILLTNNIFNKVLNHLKIKAKKCKNCQNDHTEPIYQLSYLAKLSLNLQINRLQFIDLKLLLEHNETSARLTGTNHRIPESTPTLIIYYTHKSQMVKGRHDFFSDPQWPYLHASLLLLPGGRTPSEQSVKEEDTPSSQLHPSTHPPCLFDPSPTPSHPCQPKTNLKESDSEQKDPFSKEKISEMQAEKLLESVFVKSESSHLDDHLKIEEFSEEYEKGQTKGCIHEGTFNFSKYRILSKDVKQFLVDQAEKHSIAFVSKKYGVSSNNLNRWKKRLDRRTGAGRKVADKEMEERLVLWLKNEMKKNAIVTRRDIQNKALLFSSHHTFKASKGWFERFVKRNRQLHLMEYFGMKLKDAEPDWLQMEVTTLDHFVDNCKDEYKPFSILNLSPDSNRRSKRLLQITQLK